MDRMLYIGMTGAKHHMHSLKSVSNNLANATTTGFREDLSQFRSMPVFGPGHPTRAYSMAERPGLNFSPGPLQQTGRELDVAVEGEGWIAVQTEDGSEALTRAGNLKITPNGQLVNASGHAILGEDGPIAIPPAEKVEFAGDGTISIRPAGQNAVGMVIIDRVKLVDPPKQELIKGKDGIIRHESGEPQVADANIRLVSGALEGSNVNAVNAMVRMIDLQRNYEMQVKAMSAANTIAESATSVVRMT
ncbi:MAG: flagellar basal-body rod protein FlgF [Gammaproteobacteria bacterium]|nr:flagellar basal-body rod protein FlgF [Gammaproteobacteria bacterium]